MSWKSIIFRSYSTSKTTKFFTTPIYYVNASPHIGHLYSSVIADAAQRWQRVRYKGAQIKFSTGTDEHGTKIQQAAKAHQSSVSNYCDRISSTFRVLADKFSIQYTDFIRTTDESHKNTVQSFWRLLDKNGHIYQSTYQGWYCVPDETFLGDSQLREIIKDGKKQLVSAESGHSVEWSKESNYIFRLSAFRNDLIHWLTTNEKAVRPQKFHKILLDMVYNDDVMSDISVSRPSARVHWGIPVPNDATQNIYVWLDALSNYLTVAGYNDSEFKQCWPPDVQVIGKDILKFHGVYWPAFLIGAGLEPPTTILCHSHWTVDSDKMSKSKGNVVDPIERSEMYTTDGLRYFLLREGVSHSDGNYSDTKVMRILNSELADTMGNLLSRCCGKSLNPRQVFPVVHSEALEKIASMDVTKKLLENLQTLPDICESHYNDFNFYKAADSIIATLHSANLFFETLKPWELKSEITHQKLNVVLHLAMETLRISGILLQPLTPNISHNILSKLNVKKGERYFHNAKQLNWDKQDFIEKELSKDTAIIFKRILNDVKKEQVVKKA